MLVLLAIPLLLLGLAAAFGFLFSLLATRLNSGSTSEWLDGFSLDAYRPMERLLDRSDVEFLQLQPGYRPEIGKQLMRERREIFLGYLSRLVRDFNQLISIGKLMVVYSPRDRHQFASELFRRQVKFYGAVCAIRAQLVFYPLVWTTVDAHRLVTGIAAMRDQVQSLTSSRLSAFDIA